MRHPSLSTIEKRLSMITDLEEQLQKSEVKRSDLKAENIQLKEIQIT
jgi:hypothetical protein